ncbi:MAG: hypothetical protein Phog2KO_37040 [Phototrophicaceae bacterium]
MIFFAYNGNNRIKNFLSKADFILRIIGKTLSISTKYCNNGICLPQPKFITFTFYKLSQISLLYNFIGIFNGSEPHRR